MRVVPDQTGIDKTFDYLVPPRWRDQVAVGTRVRVALGARRVGAWVVEVGVDPPEGVDLREITKVSGHGPSPELIELAAWARWRWAAKSRVPFLRTASPRRNVATLPAQPPPGPAVPAGPDAVQAAFADSDRPAVLRLPPSDDLFAVTQAAVHRGPALFVCATHTQAQRIAARLRRARVPVVVHPDEWAAAAAGGVSVVGTRSAAWAPIADAASMVVFDEHDETHQEESSPTWNARDVVVERARRAGVPCVLTSPSPTLESLGTGALHTIDRATERAGWPAVIVVDRREDDAARNALFSPTFADLVRSGARILSVLNVKGRAALLSCRTCGALARCERCRHALRRPDDVLVCVRCGLERPVVCDSCGGVDVRTARMGVSRVADDLAALAGEEVTTITGESDAARSTRLTVGTEAALHRVDSADVVAFLDFDQELFTPRYRSAEQAMALVVRAGRIVGGRGRAAGGGRVLLQTRAPDHEVVRAALAGDPTVVTDLDAVRRSEFALPPFVAVAEVAGAAASAFVAAVADRGVTVQGPVDERWRIVAPDHTTLCDALAAVPRPPGRLRLAVDPARL